MNESKKGCYDKEEVDRYLGEIVRNYEENLAAQKERIFAQVEDIDKLKAELLTHKKREKFISQAILSALQKAEQIETAAKQKYETELNKLQAFYEKFVNYYKSISEIYPVDDEIEKIEQFLKSMEGILTEKSRTLESSEINEDEARTMESYESERKRLSQNGWQIKPIEEQINSVSVKSERLFQKNTSGAEEIAANLLVGLDIKTPVSKIKKYLDRTLPREPAPAVIDLEEVLRPTQSLEDLCAELGLLSDDSKKR